jgi:hypothetical protein
VICVQVQNVMKNVMENWVHHQVFYAIQRSHVKKLIRMLIQV